MQNEIIVEKIKVSVLAGSTITEAAVAVARLQEQNPHAEIRFNFNSVDFIIKKKIESTRQITDAYDLRMQPVVI